MNREIIILDCHEIKCPLVLLFVFNEFIGYFKRNNYIVKTINDINQLHNNSVIFMGNSFNCNNPSDLLNNIAPDAIYIGWYWHDINVDNLKYFIHTYENMLNIYYDMNRINDLLKIRLYKNNIPFSLRANEDPMLIGTYEKNIKYDYCYMGWRYCENLIPNNYKGFYHGVYDHNLFLDYENRKKIYLSSMFALGFQSQTNIYSKHVSQRIYEGLTYGCIVLSNSLPACEQTNNIVIYVESKEDIEKQMEYYMNNPEIAQLKRNQGYEFSKQYGTNEFTSKNFINLIKSNFDINI